MSSVLVHSCIIKTGISARSDHVVSGQLFSVGSQFGSKGLLI